MSNSGKHDGLSLKDAIERMWARKDWEALSNLMKWFPKEKLAKLKEEILAEKNLAKGGSENGKTKQEEDSEDETR